MTWYYCIEAPEDKTHTKGGAVCLWCESNRRNLWEQICDFGMIPKAKLRINPHAGREICSVNYLKNDLYKAMYIFMQINT